MRNGKTELKHKYLPEEQVLAIELQSGEDLDVEIEFSGAIPRLLTGLYLARSGNEDIFTTQFESTGARRMFPCIDHPRYKATFDISVEIDSGLDAISNMPVEREEVSGNRKKVGFRTTPVMSTYLLYLGVGRFDTRSVKRKKTDIILAAPKGGLTSSDFPLEIASRVLDEFEDYFGIDYVLPKVHIISVPEFAAGAMENWGAITFREVYLSIDNSTSSFSYKATGEVIAHELAHQWFGNLVTMEWWNDLWLNESFATFMAYKILTRIHPEWDTLGDMVLLRTEGALKNDALRNSHPIDADVKSPDDIAQIFDEISYGKGASILRMIEGYVGEKNFRDGIRKYLKDNMYGNAKGSDLWSSIEQVSGMPVSKVMEAWIKIRGYPAVTLQGTDGKYSLTQDQFLLSGSKTDQIWPIPLTYYEGGKTRSELLDTKEKQIEASGQIKINANFSGFYRTIYDNGSFESITEDMSNLGNLDIWGLANDSFNLMLSGRLNHEDYLLRLKKFWDAGEPLVINEISTELRTLHLIAPESARVKSMAREYCSAHLGRIGEKKKGEPINTSVARTSLKATLSQVDDEFAQEQGSRFEKYFSLDSDERASVALSFARTGGSFEQMEAAFVSAKTDEDRTRILSAMGWLQSEQSLEKALGLIKAGKVKKQDTSRFYLGAAASPNSRTFMFNNMDYAIRQLKEVYVGSRTPARVLEAIAPILGISREEEMREILHGYNTQDLATSVKKSIELLSVNLGVNRVLSNL